jgi:RNA polymerase sigma-70 factor (ECF subfamily)
MTEPGNMIEPAKPDEVFLNLFTQNCKPIRAYIFALLHGGEGVEDVFQSTTLALWRKFDQFDPDANFLAWACGFAYLEVLNHFRAVSRDRLRFNDELLKTLADERLQREQHTRRRSAALEQCVKKLPERDRTLVEDAYNGKQTIKELATRLNRAAQTIYNRLNFIRRTLFECVEKELIEKGL